jgi:adenylosuccinate lyase
MRSFHEHQDFRRLLLEDADVTAVVGAEEIGRAFDLDVQLQHVDTLFARVFGDAGAATAAGSEAPALQVRGES